MEITPRELRDTEIHSEIRGYSRDEVNDLLEQAAQAIEASNQRVTQLQDRLTSAQSEAVRTRETEDILHRTLLLAQRAADEAVAEATAKSRQMLDEAEMSSRRLVADAEAEARNKGEMERRRLEEEIVELAGRRDTLLADVEALTRFEAEYRERMVRALESDLSTLRTRPTTAPASLPETSEVEIPASLSAVASPVADDDEPSLPAVPVVRQESAAPADAPSARSSNGDSGARADSRADALANGRAENRADTRAGGAETSEVDVRTLFEQSREPARVQPEAAPAAAPAPAPASSAPAPAPAPAPEASEATAAATARAAGFQPIDLAGDGVDADILDDDAFFATLRDAVHDEKPLGPRDDDDLTGEHVFFDQDADRGSFRDVFRRRR